jgi:uncharacterized membrane protein
LTAGIIITASDILPLVSLQLVRSDAMRIPSPFQMNDWETRRFLFLVAVLYVAMWGLIGWEGLGLSLPIVRPLIGLLCIAFVPGMAILRALNIHKMGSIKTVVISVVLSLATTMLSGLFLNSFRIVLGIDRPISAIPLMIVMSIVVAVLCVYILRREEDSYRYSTVSIRDIIAPPHMLLMAIVLLTVSGTILLNANGDNFVILLALAVMSMVFVLIGFDVFFSPRFYPAIVFVISLSLLLHTSLVSDYIWGADSQLEHFLSSSVLSKGYWDPSFPSAINGLLSVVILAPAISCVCDLDLVWTFKVVYPLLFSLVPLGLYRVYKEQTDEKKAVLASIFFVSLFTFFREMIQLARQEIAELILVVILIVMMEKRLDAFKKSSLLLVFGFGLVVSHNGLTYIFITLLVMSWFLLSLIKKTDERETTRYPSGRFVAFCLLIAITWYTYVSKSAAFSGFVQTARIIFESSFGNLLNPGTSQGLALISSPSPAIINYVSKVVFLLPQLFISFCVLFYFLAKRRGKMKSDFLAFSGASYLIMIAGLIVPFLASSLNASRLYQIGLILLSPFCVIGGLLILVMAAKRLRVNFTKRTNRNLEGLLSAFFVVFLLFNTGFVYQLAGQPTSFSLDSRLDTARFNNQEIAGAEWLLETKSSQIVYADAFRWLLIGSFDWNETYTMTADILELPPNAYIFLGTINVQQGKVLMANKTGTLVSWEYVDIRQMLDMKSRIFDDGGSMTYY